MVSKTLKTWIKSSVLVLSSSVANAGALPPIATLPIIRSDNPQYSEAAIKFQEALFLQIGITNYYNMFGAYLDKEIDVYAKVAEKEAYYLIDNYTPVNHNQVVFVVATGYTIAVKKEFSTSFHNPLLRSVTHKITVGESGASTNITIPF